MTTTTAYKAIVKRAAIYCRISAADEGDDNGVTRQLEDCQAIANRIGATVNPDHIFIENDVSATKYGTRKLYGKLIELIRSGQVDVIIVWRVDRLIRIPRELEDLIDIAETGTGEVITATGEMDLTSANGCMVARMLVAVAKAEIDNKHDRAVRANRQRAEQGKSPQVRCFGYRSDGSIIEAEAAIVREAFRRWNSGTSLNAVGKYLAGTGVQSAGRRQKSSTNPNAWTRAGARIMLANPRYVGQVWYRGEYLPDAVAQWEQIIDEATFTAAQVRLNDPSRETTLTPAKKHIGSGLYLCGVCLDNEIEQRMVSTGRRRPSGKFERGYRCPTLKHNHRGTADKIDAFVEDRVMTQFRDPKFWERYQATSDSAGAIAQALKDRARLKTLSLQLSDDLDSGFRTREQFARANIKNQAEMAKVDARIMKLSRADEAAEMAASRDPAALWLGMDVWQRTRLLRRFFRVVLYPNPPGAAPRFDPRTVDVTKLEAAQVTA